MEEAKLDGNNKQKTGTTSGVWDRLCRKVDGYATRLINTERSQVAERHHAARLSKTRLNAPEDEVKRLITTASDLEDIWEFFFKRLKNGSALDLLLFSVQDERGDLIRVRNGYPLKEDAEEAILSMADHGNHLVQAYHRKDTTFSPRLSSLGEDITATLAGGKGWSPDPEAKDFAQEFSLFSVPLIAGDEVIAMLTLGFAEMDAFSQAKLSYVYTLRDQIAQLTWNLILQDRMKSQAQIDNLTGLLSYSYFQRVLERELDRADAQQTPVTVMVLDINNIEEINQTQGHSAGDEAICHLASTVRRLIRGLDTIARYGGDEVVVVLPETDPASADEIAERFVTGFTENLPAALHGCSISIGHATYPDDTRKREDILKRAEQALHLAKFKGSKTHESTRIGSHEINNLNDKTVIEVFASQVAKKYNNIHVPSIYQSLLSHIDKKAAPADATIITPESQAEALMLETITSLSGALEAKDRYTRGHSQAVANYAVALAHALKMTPVEVEEVRAAAFLHDIGKIGIPESILNKTGMLNEKEWEIMKQHPVIGAQQILAPVKSLQGMIPAVECHHENWDGSGHPHGYKGERIPIGARIISIVDAFHALTSDRAYRRAMTVAEAKKILQAGAGTKWDPNLIEVFFRILSIASPRNPQGGTAEENAAESAASPLMQMVTSTVQLKFEPFA